MLVLYFTRKICQNVFRKYIIPSLAKFNKKITFKYYMNHKALNDQ